MIKFFCLLQICDKFCGCWNFFCQLGKCEFSTQLGSEIADNQVWNFNFLLSHLFRSSTHLKIQSVSTLLGNLFITREELFEFSFAANANLFENINDLSLAWIGEWGMKPAREFRPIYTELFSLRLEFWESSFSGSGKNLYRYFSELGKNF